jgi:hypothetical protein
MADTSCMMRTSSIFRDNREDETQGAQAGIAYRGARGPAKAVPERSSCVERALPEEVTDIARRQQQDHLDCNLIHITLPGDLARYKVAGQVQNTPAAGA